MMKAEIGPNGTMVISSRTSFLFSETEVRYEGIGEN